VRDPAQLHRALRDPVAARHYESRLNRPHPDLPGQDAHRRRHALSPAASNH